MKHAIFLAASAAMMIAAAPARAQPVAADLLPAYEVATIVTSMGMRPVGRPAWQAGRYVVAAIDRYGREVNVVLDARDGQVIAVRPLARNSFGPPPHGYPPRPVPYGPRDGAAPLPGAAPDSPPPDDDEFFDNERQQGALPPPAPGRAAPAPRETAATGSIVRHAPAARSDRAVKDQTPMPRPRPALARANDPSTTPPAKPADKPVAAAKPEEKKPDTASAPEAPKPNVRVIDLSKPKATAKPEDKPGEAIRF